MPRSRDGEKIFLFGIASYFSLFTGYAYLRSIPLLIYQKDFDDNMAKR
jgi:hypothetical protein